MDKMMLNPPVSSPGLKRPRELILQESPRGHKNKTGKKDVKHVKKIDARSIVTQSSEAALKNGQLDVEAFLRSREFEIKALQDGIQKARKNMSKKAFQRVPREMRRRTASHNVKRLPKRLKARAAHEMKCGNTPTVNAIKRKPKTSRGRLRLETAKKLSILASKKKITSKGNDEKSNNICTRLPRTKLRKGQLNQAPILKTKFRKRQVNKIWLPTHIWHAKRAKMTDAKNSLWRFAIPLTPTEKCYRPIHRAAGARGAIVWDMSYISTICLEGSEIGLETFLKKVGVTEKWLWEEKGIKWRDGKRSWTGWLSKLVEDKPVYICPSIILWCPPEFDCKSEKDFTTTSKKSSKALRRQIFVRIHPAAFLEIWAQFLHSSRLQHPPIHIQDLRFEIGSIDITGPGSTEALLGILHPYLQKGMNVGKHAETFLSLSGLTNPATLPHGAILSFSIMDPRLRYPPRTIKLPSSTATAEESFKLLQILAKWPVDNFMGSNALFSQDARFKAAQLPSQKAIYRRKGLALPGSYPLITVNDPRIPIILLVSRSNVSSSSSQGTWTLLAPWKCILPIWHGLVHYPLSTGGNPRFGGLEELRQIHFEHGSPYFPIDYLGTSSGFAWELKERLVRKSDWEKKPKGKRIEWDSLDLGNKRIGEVGQGWSCDFEYLLHTTTRPMAVEENSSDKEIETEKKKDQFPPLFLEFLRYNDFLRLLSKTSLIQPPSNTVATIRITLISRGVAKSCARLYRLPTSSINTATTLREQWLSILPKKNRQCKKSKAVASILRNKQNTRRIPVNTPLPQRVRLLAQSLLQQPPLPYPRTSDSNKSENASDNEYHPLVPNSEDLIGFVTTGQYCLADGRSAAVGSILICRVLDESCNNRDTFTINNGITEKKKFAAGAKFRKLCIVRNSGESVGRLAMWEPIQ